jgi:hypothetical protein
MWQRLNVWISWVLAGTLGLSVFLQLFPLVALPLAVVIPTWAWWTGRLLPTTIATGRESRWRWGQRLLAIANVVVLAGIFLPFISGALSDHRELFAFSIVGAFSLFPAVPLWIAGLWCVYSAADREVASTSRAAPDVPHAQAGVSLKNIAVLFLGAIGLAVAAWAVNVATLTTRWREDVRLSDGSTLTVGRSIKHRRGGELDLGTVKWALEERLSFRDPATGQKIVWQAPHRVAARVDRLNDSYWVVGKLTTRCLAEHAREPVWVAYQYAGGKWHPIDAKSAPPFIKPNLLLDSYNYADTSRLRHLTLNQKNDLDSSSTIDAMYRSIDLFLMQRC